MERERERERERETERWRERDDNVWVCCIYTIVENKGTVD